jgi:AraC-like DNA-binding protein
VVATLPLPNERIYAPYKIGAMVEVLAEQGIPAEESLKGSGVSVAQLYDVSTLTSMRQYITVCQNAVALSRDPTTAFEVGARLHLSAYGIYGYALMSCMSLRDYFRLAVKYRRLATPPITIEWVEYPDTVVWTFPDAFVSGTPPELREFLIEQQVSVNVTHLQEVAGQSCPPLKANFAYTAPAHADVYPRYLGCPCFFDQQQSELIYASAILEQKPAKTGSGTSGEVYQILMRQPGEFPTMEVVAKALNMTGRTLRRRLEAEDTSFQGIVDDVRCSLALEYLKTTKMSTNDIAMLLGFSDASNFRRALKRWTGKGAEQLRG